MSGESLSYPLKRGDCGHAVNRKNKEETELKFLCFKSDYTASKNFEPRNPKSITLGNIPEKSCHTVHTEKTKTKSVLMKHTEGGWPETVKDQSYESREAQQWKRHKEKNDENFPQKVKILIATTSAILKQNLRMDIYEEYFDENEVGSTEDIFSAKIKTVFKDIDKYKRTVTKIVFSPDEEQTRIAVAYKLHKGQSIEPNYKFPCLVWDLSNPNSPVNTMVCDSEITAVAFNSKQTNFLGVGCANGSALIFDLHTSKIIAQTKSEDHSHSEAVSDFIWIKSRTGMEFVTTSTDGKVIWWEIKNYNSTVVPTPPVVIEPEKPLMLVDKTSESEKEYGGVRIEYNQEAGSTKFLIAAEQGTIFLANKKKNEAEITSQFGFKWGRHLGPITGIQRCPVSTKFFLTVGDWTAKIWTEDFKSPVMISKYHPSYLTDCIWSSRCGLYFISRADGWINAYDLCYKINEPAFAYKVCDSPITSISINVKGDKLVVGDEEGKVYLIKLSKSFYSQHDVENKKDYINKFFERELAREKNIENSLKRKGQPVKDDTAKIMRQEQIIKEKIRKIDENYATVMGAMLDKPMLKEERKEPAKNEEVKVPENKEESKKEEDKKDLNTSKVSQGGLNKSEANLNKSALKEDEEVNKSKVDNVNESKRNLNNSNLNVSSGNVNEESKQNVSVEKNENSKLNESQKVNESVNVNNQSVNQGGENPNSSRGGENNVVNASVNNQNNLSVENNQNNVSDNNPNISVQQESPNNISASNNQNNASVNNKNTSVQQENPNNVSVSNNQNNASVNNPNTSVQQENPGNESNQNPNASLNQENPNNSGQVNNSNQDNKVITEEEKKEEAEDNK